MHQILLVLSGMVIGIVIGILFSILTTWRWKESDE